MNILLVSARYLPHRGGLESVVGHLATELKTKGHSVRIVTNRYPRNLKSHEVVNGVQVERMQFILPDKKYLRSGRVDLWLAGFFLQYWTKWRLSRLISSFEPDILNSHYLNEVAEITGRCLSKMNVPWVISLHGGDVDGEPLQNEQKRDRFCRLTQQARYITTCSANLMGQALLIAPKLTPKIKTIQNGVDIQRFKSVKHHQEGFSYILALGQLVWHKGYDILVNAFSVIADVHPEIHLIIAGEGEFRKELERLIAEKHLEDRISILGRVDEERAAQLMAGCLFFVMPSRREPFGIVALEGMAAGKIVLASPVGGVPEFLPVPPNRFVQSSVDDWSKALDAAIIGTKNGVLLGVENIREAEKHSWSAVADEYLAMYEKGIPDG